MAAQVILARVVETGEVVAIKRIHIKHGSQDGLPDNIFRELKSLMVSRSNCRREKLRSW